jgi:hypothetical protein
MFYSFSVVSTKRTYQIELRERNYPKFECKFNAYIAVFGQLSGDYMGSIEKPIATDITEDSVPGLLLTADKFIEDNRYYPVSIW